MKLLKLFKKVNFTEEIRELLSFIVDIIKHLIVCMIISATLWFYEYRKLVHLGDLEKWYILYKGVIMIIFFYFPYYFGLRLMLERFIKFIGKNSTYSYNKEFTAKDANELLEQMDKTFEELDKEKNINRSIELFSLESVENIEIKNK